MKALTPETKAALAWSWDFWARPDQIEPEGDDWTTWLILAGRGWGKTRTGAETIRKWVCGSTPLGAGRYKRIALVAETTADARGVMVDGESGILHIGPKDFRPTYQPSLRQLTWPNGAIATTYNAVEPDQLRGPQHDAAWCDEVAKWRYMQETWDQLQMGLRLGSHPKQIITTTPRPEPLIRRLLKDPSCRVTRGRTWDNADNLAAPFLKQIADRYNGTRLGRQELEGEVLDDMPGALWNRDMLDEARVSEAPEELERIVVGVDPAATSGEDADETGIVVVGIARDEHGNTHGYVLEDGSMRGSPEEWASRAVGLYHIWDADMIVAEKNQGGEMVSSVLKAVDRNVPVTLVHATRGKHVRAEPISALYEQGRVHHVGKLHNLEDQMCLFTKDADRKAGNSPDRVDALVWALTSVFEKIVRARKVQTSASSDYLIKPQSTQQYSNKPDTSWMA